MKQIETRAEGRTSRTAQAKRYEPVREFERATSYCPLYLAWRIVDEARDYFRTEIPESYARKLARRAEAVFAHQPFWARKASPRAQFRNREYILMSMRHWLAGVLVRERPALFRALPESSKNRPGIAENAKFCSGGLRPPALVQIQAPALTERRYNCPAFRPRLRTAPRLDHTKWESQDCLGNADPPRGRSLVLRTTLRTGSMRNHANS